MARTRVEFETIAEQRARNVRRNDDDEQGPNPMGYVDVEGAIRGQIGDRIGPYQNVIGRASSTGLADQAVAHGEHQRLLLDLQGRVYTSPDTTEVSGVFHYMSNAVEGQVNLFAGPGTLYQVRIIVGDSVTADRFLLAFDTSAATVNDGAQPDWAVLAPSGLTDATQYAEGADDFEPTGGFAFTAGCVLAVSTQPGPYLAPAGDDAWILASYKPG